MQIDIKVPYTTRPSMHRRVGPAFVSPPSMAKILAKQKELAQHDAALWAQTDIVVEKNLISQSAAHCGKPVTDNLLELALSFQEDIAIMHRGQLAAVCFCFPSGWIPANKIGLGLADIHQPVADNVDLVRMSAKLATTMADPVLGGFQRQVWTVTTNPALSNFPDTNSVAEPRSIDDLYFRWETQTTEPLGDGATSLFFVDVNVVPLREVWTKLGARIADSVNSMTDAVLDYKNLRSVKMILNMGA